ncbi:hypothetical protein JYB62_01890 [Algoriphagus lutimaris]|uniref:hypothetical protein n=1 Tax=Algoriphagus lutimaris TaxID=613197 RepID=UPI00196B4F4E|nr:hypothetical protein [Algoriphagus lutimaris]MBN3518739.1 hypothetical protein [Algoriphagus lutimaris]
MNWIVKLRDKLFGLNKLEYNFLFGKINQNQDYRFKELKAIEVLKPYFPKEYVFETSFSLSFQTIQHIANDIVINRPKIILEIGSGLSTIILNNLISDLDYNPEFISIDQDGDWQKYLQPQCPRVKFFAFGITSSNEFSYERKGEWFDIPNTCEVRFKSYDLVIIDGPKGFGSKFARYGVVEFLNGRVNGSSILFLDDTDRPDEQFVLRNLKEKFSMLYVSSNGRYTRLSRDTSIITSPS